MKQKNKHWCMVYIKIKEYQESNVVNVIQKIDITLQKKTAQFCNKTTKIKQQLNQKEIDFLY